MTMTRLHIAIGLGFLLGLRHALDSDHIVAMSTLIARAKRRGAAWLLGACWGLGHTLTILAAGVAVVVVRIHIPNGLAPALECSVGGMLAILGIMNLADVRMGNWGIEEHVHEHGHDLDDRHHHHVRPAAQAEVHSHPHAHMTELENILKSVGRFQLARSFGVGMAHGLAGSTAVALLVLTAVPGEAAAMTYLLVFGAGSMLGMAALSAFMELAMRKAMQRVRLESWIVPATGMMSLLFGLYIMYRFGRPGG